MNTATISVVLYGRDAHLLELRKWFLHSLGYRVFTAMQLCELDGISTSQPIALITLCHTVAATESEVALAKAALRWPGIKSLSLARDGSRSSAAIPDTIGPSANAAIYLSNMISHLVGHSGSSPHSHTY